MSLRTTGARIETVTIGAGKKKQIWSISEAGENQYIMLLTNYYQMKFTLLVDNIPIACGPSESFQPATLHVYQGNPAEANESPRVGGPGIWLAQFLTATDNYGIIINLPLKWKISLVLRAENSAGTEKQVQASIIYDKLAEIPTLEVPKRDLQVPKKWFPWWPF